MSNKEIPCETKENITILSNFFKAPPCAFCHPITSRGRRSFFFLLPMMRKSGMTIKRGLWDETAELGWVEDHDSQRTCVIILPASFSGQFIWCIWWGEHGLGVLRKKFGRMIKLSFVLHGIYFNFFWTLHGTFSHFLIFAGKFDCTFLDIHYMWHFNLINIWK